MTGLTTSENTAALLAWDTQRTVYVLEGGAVASSYDPAEDKLIATALPSILRFGLKSRCLGAKVYRVRHQDPDGPPIFAGEVGST